MYQQINLYQRLPKPVKSLLTIKNTLQICVVFLLLLFLIYGYGKWQHSKQLQQLEEIKQKQKKVSTALLDITKQQPTTMTAEELQKTIQALRQELDVREHTAQSLKQTLPFSSYLEGLSYAAISGVWLTEIHIAKGGGEMTLKGNALQSQLVQQFLIKISQQPAFDGKYFKRFTVEKIKPDKNTNMLEIIRFSLSTEPEKINPTEQKQ